MNLLAILGISILIAFFFYMNDIINRMYMDVKYMKKALTEMKAVGEGAHTTVP